MSVGLKSAIGASWSFLKAKGVKLQGDTIDIHPLDIQNHPNTSWQGVLGMFCGSNYLLIRCLDVYGQWTDVDWKLWVWHRAYYHNVPRIWINSFPVRMVMTMSILLLLGHTKLGKIRKSSQTTKSTHSRFPTPVFWGGTLFFVAGSSPTPIHGHLQQLPNCRVRRLRHGAFRLFSFQWPGRFR